MVLYSTVQQEMGLKSVGFMGCGVLGRTTKFVGLHSLESCPIMKNSYIAAHINGPISSHVVLKNPLEYPSGPGYFSFGIEKITSLISLVVTAVQSISRCSMVRV